MRVGLWRDLVPSPFFSCTVSWLSHCKEVYITTIFSLPQTPSSTANQPQKGPLESASQPQKRPSESASQLEKGPLKSICRPQMEPSESTVKINIFSFKLFLQVFWSQWRGSLLTDGFCQEFDIRRKRQRPWHFKVRLGHGGGVHVLLRPSAGVTLSCFLVTCLRLPYFFSFLI